MEQGTLIPNATGASESPATTNRKAKKSAHDSALPEKLAKAIKLPVPDFADPNRKPTCLEADFPIAQINALSKIEVASGPARKRIYCMGKWWARRASSVFRSMLIAAATEAPEDKSEASKLVWDHYYCNHQKAGSFKHLKVLDCFMGGGTTLVEGSRLGMQMTGVDLNPVAWFVVKNELACSDPNQVKALFDEIERRVKPQIQPFYTTTCPRGHKGQWIDVQTGTAVDIDPIDLPPEQRAQYRWEGPEVVYTFWAKHGPCQTRGCGHRTPIFRTPVIAEKKLSTAYAELTCPSCGTQFHAELGETRMAPGAERIVLESETPFTEISQPFAVLLNDYDKGNANDTWQRADTLSGMVSQEPGLRCPHCGTFSGKQLADIVERHASATLRAAQRKKTEFKLKKKPVSMFLLIHPEWMRGATGFEGKSELGGWAGATADSTAQWFAKRGENVRLIEVRGETLPSAVIMSDGTEVDTTKGTVPKNANFSCGSCGRQNKTLQAIKATGHTAAFAAYTIQCHCPQCEIEGYTYGGRYFKAPDSYDIERLTKAESEWAELHNNLLKEFWPKEKMQYAHMTHERNPLPDHGYTHWWMMFNCRQLLVHATLLKSIVDANDFAWSLDAREQALGAWQEYSRHQSLFCFWDIQQDCLAPMLASANFNPRSLVVENNIWLKIGRANWSSCRDGVLSGLIWATEPTELFLSDTHGPKSLKVQTEDPLSPGTKIHCGSSTDLSLVGESQFDLVITDPPFGDNIYYADCADFFYSWLRLPLQKWYAGLPEAELFKPERTPHSMEAIDNSVEHPDDREDYEKEPFIKAAHVTKVRELSGDAALSEKDPNPLYRPQPSSDFYCQTLSAVWAETRERLKDGGIMAFTFHHSEDQAWIDILKALFDAGYVLVTTYPIRSDESKGDSGQFGSKKIEYDIIHVCRKRLQDPDPVSWSRMRRWVKEESKRLKDLLEHTHAKSLPESDLRVILRGKSLEFYSRHYGQVFTGDGQVLDVREALLGINQLLDDLLEDSIQGGGLRPPDSAEPSSRLYMRIFKDNATMERDELHKTLRGTGVAQGDLESLGWIRMVGKTVHVVPIVDRFAFFTAPGRNRKIIKTDLDQAHFLMGAAMPNSGFNINTELNNPNLRIKKSADEILQWYGEMDQNPVNRLAARTAAQLVSQWRKRKDKPQARQRTLFDMLEDND